MESDFENSSIINCRRGYSHIAIYPNPASDYLTINRSEEIYSFQTANIEIYNYLGNIAFESSIPFASENQQINIFTLSNCVYTIVIRTDSEVINRKFVVLK